MKKKLIALIVGLALVIPAFAVFNERNISRTISVLRHELHLAYNEKMELDKRHQQSSKMEEVQRRKMVDMVRKINELMLILYSQDSNFTFDQTYALDEVNDEYKKFTKQRQPMFVSIEGIDSEIQRYQSLVDALKMLPPKVEDIDDTRLDSLMVPYFDAADSTALQEILPEPLEVGRKSFLKEIYEYNKAIKKESADTSNAKSFILSETAREDRDSCIVYANYIITSLTHQKERVEEDNLYYDEMSRRLQETYDYAVQCYDDIQDYIFHKGQENYFSVLANLKKYLHDTDRDMEQKYSTEELDEDAGGLRGSEWRGFVLASAMFYSFTGRGIICLLVVLFSCVILRKVKPFNTEFFKKTKLVSVLLMISVIYFLMIAFECFFPMSNFARMASSIILVFRWLVISLLLSVLVGMKKEDSVKGLLVYLPVITAGYIVLMFRVLFVPDKFIHLVLAPMLLLFFVWQLIATLRFRKSGYKSVLVFQWITLCVFGMAFIMSLQGFSLLGLQVLMWWIFQVAALATLVSLKYILIHFRDTSLASKKTRYANSVKMVSKDEDGDFIKVTWLFDFLYRAVLPIASILSILFSIRLAANIFNLSETFNAILNTPFIDLTNSDGGSLLQVSLLKLVSVAACFYLFRYLNYLARSLYRVNTLDKLIEKKGEDMVRKNDVNLTLAYNIIGIIIWGMFIAYSIYILKIPVGALSLVAAGLATGLGLALKDVLNNFIYGIQLMSGRLRVGDMVECDGIRGTVEKISYQSTEILTITDSVISFTNSTLFNKNFQNLTKNTPYEYLAIPVSIPYGEDVDKVRKILLEALEGYRKKKDKYGRYLLEKHFGIYITLSEFAESSVNLSISQMVLVESKWGYMNEVRELVYNVFKDNGIEIPFPKREVTLRTLPSSE